VDKLQRHKAGVVDVRSFGQLAAYPPHYRYLHLPRRTAVGSKRNEATSEREEKATEKAMAKATSSGGGPKMVTGLFKDSESVERAYQSVVKRGYDKGDINVVMSDDTRRRSYSEGHQIDPDLRSKVAEGGELGGPTGGTIGIVIPVLAAVGTFLAFPGLGLVVGGPIAVALAGAGVAGLAVGLIGLFSNWGIPEERAQQYETGIHDG
jgi:hypothetical protein